jgi:hypothetical protein
MKKLLSLLMVVCMSATLIFAQTQKPAPKEKAKTEVKTASPDAKPAATATKKDGTPDMRFKANKEAAKPTGPTKKDGTPDKRFKENKTAPAKK